MDEMFNVDLTDTDNSQTRGRINYVPILSPQASLSELNLEHNLYVGGIPDMELVNPESGVRVGLDGAIQRISVNGDIWDRPLSRALWSHGVRRYRGPPCDSNGTLCLNDGVCVPNLNAPLCRCPLYYWGARCEKSKNFGLDKISDYLCRTFFLILSAFFLGIAKEDLERPVAFEGNVFLSFSSEQLSGCV